MLLVRPISETSQYQLVRSAHETFARTLSSSLSSFLQAEIGAELAEASLVSAGDFKESLSSPGCFISFHLEPRPEHAVLSLDPITVFSFLELLLGGSGSTRPEPRVLTEIEWSLLEEVVRVLVRSLGEAWKTFHAVEFKVQALDSDPPKTAFPHPSEQVVRFAFTLQLGDQAGGFQIAVPRTFFEEDATTEETTTVDLSTDNVQRNWSLLEDAKVDVEVVLEGPTMAFQELAALSPGEVIRFDYPLDRTVRAVANGAVSIPCLIVSSGKKRAFQAQELD